MKLRFEGKKVPATLAGLALAVVLTFQNCGPGFEVLPQLGVGEFGSGVMLEDCLSSPNYDACLFYKNPSNALSSVADTDSNPLTPSSANQMYAVQLKLGANRQELSNDNLMSLDWSGQLVRSPSWRVGIEQDPNGAVPAAMGFYWSQRLLDVVDQTQTVDLSNMKLKIVASARFTGWSAEEGAIFLGAGSLGRANAALDASVVTHLTTEALISHLTARAIYDMSNDSLHRDCGPLEGPVLKADCCSSKLGCSRALTAGLSDYLTAVVFQSSPAIGDYVSAKDGGANVCGVPRNPAANGNLNFPTAFSSCSDTGREGQIFNMGSVFASALFSIRSSLEPAEAAKFDALVVSTLPYLDGSDSFVSWKTRALSLDTANFGGRFGSKIDAEFARRSL